MKKIISFLIIFVFLASQIYLLYANNSMKREVALKNQVLDEQVTKYSAVQPLFELGLQNIGRMIDGDISIEDTTKSVFRLRDVINGNTLVCRISDRYCTQCVEHAVSVLTDNKSAFEFTKVLFLSDCSSLRVVKLQIQESGLDDCNVFQCGSLDLPIDNIMFPYFMVVDSTLMVKTVYAPSKSTHGTDFDYKNVKLMYDNLVDIEL